MISPQEARKIAESKKQAYLNAAFDLIRAAAEKGYTKTEIDIRDNPYARDIHEKLLEAGFDVNYIRSLGPDGVSLTLHINW